jgi:hypothetical protein
VVAKCETVHLRSFMIRVAYTTLPFKVLEVFHCIHSEFVVSWVAGSAINKWNEGAFGSGTEGLGNVPYVLPRTHLVEGIFKILAKGGLAFLQGPPYGGKTATLELVLRYAQERGIETHYINLAGISNVDDFLQRKLGMDVLDLLEGEHLRRRLVCSLSVSSSHQVSRTVSS